MTTVKRRWKETRGGKTAIVSGKTINGSENPFVGSQLGHYRSRAADEVGDAFYAVAYLIEEYGDDAIEEVAEMSKEERKEYVGAIEKRLADDDENADPQSALQDVMEN